MEQEKWINEILSSTKGMHKAEPSPFLFEQLSAKISSKKFQPVYSSQGSNLLRWGLAVFVSVLISVNILSLVKNNSGQQPRSEKGEMVNESLNNATIYNY